MTVSGSPHLVTPGSGYCDTGRKKGQYKQKTKVLPCPNRAVVGSLYCRSCLDLALKRVGVKAR